MTSHKRGPGRPFQKGQSGNPGGKAKLPEAEKKIIADVREAARECTQAAIDTLKNALSAPSAPWAAKVSAANSLLDRGWGKAREAVEVKVEESLEFLILAAARRRTELAEIARTEAQSEGREEKDKLH